MHCDVDFKTKVGAHASACMHREFCLTAVWQGFFTGSYNNVTGCIKKYNSEVGEISGQWSHTMEYRNSKVCVWIPFVMVSLLT